MLLTLRLFLAGIFALAAWGKWRERYALPGVIAGYGMLPAALVPAAAAALPVAEALSALLLPWPATSGAGAALGAGLMAAFALGIGINLARGRRGISCGCGGPEMPISPALLARAVGLGGLLAALAVADAALPSGAALAMAVPQAGALLLLYAVSEQLLANAAGRVAA